MRHIKTWHMRGRFIHLATLQPWRLRLMWWRNFFCLEIGPLLIEVSNLPF